MKDFDSEKNLAQGVEVIVPDSMKEVSFTEVDDGRPEYEKQWWAGIEDWDNPSRGCVEIPKEIRNVIGD